MEADGMLRERTVSVPGLSDTKPATGKATLYWPDILVMGLR